MSQVASSKHGHLRCADAVHARLFDDELVILDLARGEYFALDPIGARLWSGLQTGKAIGEIAREIVAEYDVEFDTALADLTALGDDLVARGLLVHEERPVEAHGR
jgi:Coenzyme PQQ synthesis protein D (PqqD)